MNELTKIQKIFRKVFDNQELIINLESNAFDIEEWDSIMHIVLLHEIEKVFGIKFKSNQINEIKNVRDILNIIN